MSSEEVRDVCAFVINKSHNKHIVTLNLPFEELLYKPQ